MNGKNLVSLGIKNENEIRMKRTFFCNNNHNNNNNSSSKNETGHFSVIIITTTIITAAARESFIVFPAIVRMDLILSSRQKSILIGLWLGLGWWIARSLLTPEIVVRIQSTTNSAYCLGIVQGNRKIKKKAVNASFKKCCNNRILVQQIWFK